MYELVIEWAPGTSGALDLGGSGWSLSETKRRGERHEGNPAVLNITIVSKYGWWQWDFDIKEWEWNSNEAN